MLNKLGVSSGASMARIFMDLLRESESADFPNPSISLPSLHLRPKLVEKWLQKPVLYFWDFFLSELAKGCLDSKHCMYKHQCMYLIKSRGVKLYQQKEYAKVQWNSNL